MTNSPSGPSAHFRLRAAVGVALFALAAGAWAAPWGVPLTGGARKAAITSPTDTDSYLVEAGLADSVSIQVKVPRSSELVPTAVLHGPDGALPEAIFETKGNKLQLRRFSAPTAGLYEVVVAGADGSQGGYTVKAGVAGSGGRTVKGLSANAGQEIRVPFGAAGGARLDFQVKTRDTALLFRRVEDPQGRSIAVQAEALRTRGNKLTGKKITLPEGDVFSEWVLVVAAPSSSVDGVQVKIRVKGPKTPRPKGSLPDVEPRLTSVDPGVVGVGSAFEVRGVGLVDPVQVFVGGRRAEGLALTGSTLVSGTIPQGLAGTHDVSLLNGDGHAARLADAIEIVPPPSVASVTPNRGPAGGGQLVEIQGTGFRPGAVVTVGGVGFAANTTWVSDTLVRFTTPSFAQGSRALSVRDAAGQASQKTVPYVFVAGPLVDRVVPALVPLLPGESIAVEGSDLTTAAEAGGSILIGGEAPAAIPGVTSQRLDIELPDLGLGTHDLALEDAFGQRASVPGAVSVFAFRSGPSFTDQFVTDIRDIALSDFDGDGDLDVFLVAAGGSTLATTSRLRVLRNDGALGFVDVTDAVTPTIVNDDWRGDCIAVGHVAGELGASEPDARPDIVIGSTDTSVLPATRSRIRLLANRAKPGGSERHLEDVTSSVFAATTSGDRWQAADLWIGDLDGNGGVADIVAVHDAPAFEEFTFAPYQVNYESGTRVFSFGGSPKRFGWQSARLPRLSGARQSGGGFPVCEVDACADDYQPFRGVSLAVADIDDDGRRDIAVTSPQPLVVFGLNASSTQIARNVTDTSGTRFEDGTSKLPASIDRLLGHHVFLVHVVGDAKPDLLVLARTAAPGTSALRVVQNNGFANAWTLRTTQVLPSEGGSEQFQADAAEVVDIDGDGDLDIVLYRARPVGTAPQDLVAGLRVLRNMGDGLTWSLDPVLPAVGDADVAIGLAVGDTDGDGGADIVLVGTPKGGTGLRVETVRRETTE